MPFLWFALVFYSGLCAAQNVIDGPVGNDLYEQTFFVFFYKCSENGTCSQKHTLNELDVLTRHPNYNHSHTTTLYIHGFHEDIKKDTVEMVVRSYMTRDDCNLVMVDWSHTAAEIYPVVRQNVEPLGELIGEFLYDAIDRKILNISMIHVVGFSAGAHVSSAIGQTIYRMSKNSTKLPRISGLEPAGPLFTPNATVFLTKADAHFVDVIHTDRGIYGTSEILGSVDFFPNGGNRPQMGCTSWTIPYSLSHNDLCSHKRAVAYWCESVECKNTTMAFYAKKRSVLESDIVIMGYGCPITSRGVYYLNTNSNSPFSLGMSGIYKVP